MFARLSPGLVCICAYVFPHIRVWICVPVCKPVSSCVSPVWLHPRVCAHISGLGQQSCPVYVSVCLSRWRRGPLFCVVIPWPLFMAWMMETDIYVVVALVLAPQSPPWRWRGLEICPPMLLPGLRPGASPWLPAQTLSPPPTHCSFFIVGLSTLFLRWIFPAIPCLGLDFLDQEVSKCFSLLHADTR